MEASHRTKGLLRLTMACNERCPFCNVPVEDYATPTPPESATVAELEAFVASGERTLTISGGEPTLMRGRLVRMVGEARGRGIPFVELQTNAVLVSAEYAAELAAAGLTSAFVSLLSHLPDHHDALAGLAGAFPDCLRGIDAFLDAGVAVTLNPVVARRTQTLLPDYVRFVARRLPRVRTISLSAVQPHGRARKNTELLPDYDVLAGAVREARKVAREAGIAVVNPYCGLPLCVGWEDGPESCVEASEAADGGWRFTPGLENRGDKAHGPPCRRCAWRPACGGAWRAYWQAREGRGIHAPALLVEPWEGVGEGQAVVRRFGEESAAFGERRTPTVWLWTDRLLPGDADLPFTHLALELRVSHLAVETLRAIRGLRGRPVRVGLRVGAEPADLGAILQVLHSLGVEGVTLLAPPQWAPMEIALRDAFPRLDVRRFG